jgi:hypothetical protein
MPICNAVFSAGALENMIECAPICDALSLLKSPNITISCFKLNVNVVCHFISNRFYLYTSYSHIAQVLPYVPFYHNFA